MASPTIIPPKSYAARGATKDIPLDDMAQFLGALVETELASATVANQAALGRAVRPTGHRVDGSLHDGIRVALYEAGGAQIDEWIIPDVEPWLALRVSSPGDTLVRDTTALRVLRESGGGALLIGRSSGNRVTIQADGFTTGENDFVAKAFGRGWTDGLLSRRLGPLRGGHPKDIVFKIRSASEPSAPVGYVIDPSTGDATPGSDGYVLVTAADPAGSDPLWNAAVHNPVDAATGLYRTSIPASDWIVYPVGSTYRQEFTADDEEPQTWTAAAPADTAYLETRVRKPDGTWAYYIVRDDRVEPWEVLFNVELTAAVSTIILPEAFDFTQRTFLEWVGRQRNPGAATEEGQRGSRRAVFFASDHIWSVATAVPDDTAHWRDIWLVMAEVWNNVNQGLVQPNAAASADQQIVRVQPYGGTVDARGTAIQGFRVTLAYTDENFQLTLRARK